MSRFAEFQMPPISPDETCFQSKSVLLGRHHTHPEAPKTPSRMYVSNLEEAETGSLIKIFKDVHTSVKVRKNALRLRLERS